MMSKRSEQLKEFTDLLLNNGYRVAAHTHEHHTPELSSWIIFSKDDKIGYAQDDRFQGISFSTVHKPCRECGTGFRAVDPTHEPTLKHAESALIFAPSWATYPQRQAIKKYKNLDDYMEKSTVLDYVELKTS